MLARGNENFRAPGENRTRDLGQLSNLKNHKLQTAIWSRDPRLRIPLVSTSVIDRHNIYV